MALRTMPCGVADSDRAAHLSTCREARCARLHQWLAEREQLKLPPGCIQRRVFRAAVLRHADGKRRSQDVASELLASGYASLYRMIHAALYDDVDWDHFLLVVQSSLTGLQRGGYLQPKVFGVDYQLTADGRAFIAAHEGYLEGVRDKQGRQLGQVREL